MCLLPSHFSPGSSRHEITWIPRWLSGWENTSSPRLSPVTHFMVNKHGCHQWGARALHYKIHATPNYRWFPAFGWVEFYTRFSFTRLFICDGRVVQKHLVWCSRGALMGLETHRWDVLETGNSNNCSDNKQGGSGHLKLTNTTSGNLEIKWHNINDCVGHYVGVSIFSWSPCLHVFFTRLLQ